MSNHSVVPLPNSIARRGLADKHDFPYTITMLSSDITGPGDASAGMELKMRLSEQSAIVTGGAGGLGEAVVRRLHRAGAYVVLADLADDRAVALAAELGNRVQYVRADVTSEPEVRGRRRRSSGGGPAESRGDRARRTRPGRSAR